MPHWGSTSVRASLFAGAVLAVTVGAVLLVVRALSSNSSTTSGQALPHDAPPAAISARVLCTLSNEDAAAALVEGADGGASVVVGGKTWWLFGDTLFAGRSGKQIEANSLASSSSARREDGCPRLEYYAPDGVAVPFIEKDGSLTVWPTGGWATGDTGFDFYTAYVYGSGPYDYTVDDIGVGHFDTTTMRTTILARRLWDQSSGFTSRVLHAQPVEVADDGKLRLVLHTESTSKLLARVEPSRIADPTAYEYWDGAGWSASPASAAALWILPAGATDVEKLALFENGSSIAWNEALGKYVALVNVGYETVGARIAERLEGPWSEPVKWLDCLAFAKPRVPTCYSPQQHPSLAAADGGTIVTTISAIEPYRMHVVEITLGTAIHEFRSGDEVRYSAKPLAGWEDQGIAFYASDAAATGLAPVYGWQRGDEVQYAPTSPDEGFERKEIAFWSPTDDGGAGALVHDRPVYDWHDGGETHVLSPLAAGLEQYGYSRGDIMFYAP